MKYEKLAFWGLISSALFWGISGVLTQLVLEEMSPLALIFFRFFISGIIALVVFRINLFKLNKAIYRHSIILSGLLIVIYISSTYGLKYTSASNAGFIIGSAVVIVPLANRLIYKTKLMASEWVSAIICLLGLSFITLRGLQPLNLGDFLCLVDAVAYAFYIIYNSRLPENTDAKSLIGLQYIFVTILSFAYLGVFERPTLYASRNIVFYLLILSVFSTFIAFYVQLLSQKYMSAEKAGKILTLIPIFTVIFDFLIYGKILTPSSALGGSLIILAIGFDEKWFESLRLLIYKFKSITTKLPRKSY